MSDDLEKDIEDRLRLVLNRRRRGLRVDFTVGFPSGKAFVAFYQAARSEIDLQLRFISPEQRKPVHLFFCEDETYGAFAEKDVHNFIVLNLGVIPTLYDFFNRLLSVSSFWPGIGTAVDEENISPEHIEAVRLPAWKSWAALPAKVPDDVSRVAFAIIFATHCLEFLVRHELAHILLGHCDLMEIKQCGAYMDDTDDRLPDQIDPILIQSLEMTADVHAAILGYEKLLHEPKLFGTFPDPIDRAYRHFHQTQQEAIEHYLLTLFFVFRLLDQGEQAWNGDKILLHRHPPAAFRFHAACVHLLAHLQSHGRSTEADGVQRAMQKVWDIGETMFATALGRQPDPNPKDHATSEQSEKHFELLQNCLANLPETFSTLDYIKTE